MWRTYTRTTDLYRPVPTGTLKFPANVLQQTVYCFARRKFISQHIIIIPYIVTVVIFVSYVSCCFTQQCYFLAPINNVVWISGRSLLWFITDFDRKKSDITTYETKKFSFDFYCVKCFKQSKFWMFFIQVLLSLLKITLAFICEFINFVTDLKLYSLNWKRYWKCFICCYNWSFCQKLTNWTSTWQLSNHDLVTYAISACVLFWNKRDRSALKWFYVQSTSSFLRVTVTLSFRAQAFNIHLADWTLVLFRRQP